MSNNKNGKSYRPRGTEVTKGTYTTQKGRKKQYSTTRGSKDRYSEPGSNDPAWYAANQSILKDSASIPYSWALGTPIDMANPLNSSSEDRKLIIPGVQTLYLVPSVGLSEDPASPINIASNSTYAFIRHANSGHSNYDAPDLMLYILSMSQVYSYIVFLQRAYGACTLYAQKNRYVPDALLEAMYIDPSVKSDLANFRYGINVLIQKAASFAVPNTMTFFNRQAFIYSNLYMEGDSIKDQIYMYSPDSFWRFQWNTDNSAGELVNKQFYGMNGHKATVSELLAYGNDLLNQLIMDEDMNIMSGDILKAYGSDKIVKLQPLPTEYPLIPVYNMGVLEQMKNATVTGQFPGCVGTKVHQDATKGYLICHPTVTTVKDTSVANWINDAARQAMSVLLGNRIITTAVADATPEVTIENTRLVAQGASIFYDGDNTSVYLYTGTEVCSFCKNTYFTCWTENGLDSIGLNFVLPKYAGVIAEANLAGMGVNYNMKQYFILNSFKYHPASYASNFKASATANKADYLLSILYFEVDNYAVLNQQDVQRMHEAALLNEFNVPMIAKI